MTKEIEDADSDDPTKAAESGPSDGRTAKMNEPPDGSLSQSGTGVDSKHLATTVLTDGGEEIREYREVKNADDIVRHYQADGDLYAYRVDDEHVVVSRGRDRRDRWTIRVPSDRESVVVGERLWTIPDNWRLLATVGEVGVDGLYYRYYGIPESEVDVKVAYGTRDHVCDCWYSVTAVGEVELGITSEVDTEALAGPVHDYPDLTDDARTALERIANQPDVFAEHWCSYLNRFVDEAWEQAYGQVQGDEMPSIDPDGVDIWGDVVDLELLLTEKYGADISDAKELDRILREVAVPSYPRVRPRIAEKDEDESI